MATFELPYGRESVRLTVDDGHLAGVLRSGIHEYRPADDPWTIVRSRWKTQSARLASANSRRGSVA